MKRGWFGAALLLVLLGLGIGSSMMMQKLHTPLAESLDRAAEFALEGNWEQAEHAAREAADTWEKMWHFSATVSDHEPMEEIDALFAQLEVYRAAEDPVNFSSACASLSRQIEAMGDAHELSWWNLL